MFVLRYELASYTVSIGQMEVNVTVVHSGR